MTKFGDVSDEDMAWAESEAVTQSCGCVFCDLSLEPTNCTDGWFHLLDEGRTVACDLRNSPKP